MCMFILVQLNKCVVVCGSVLQRGHSGDGRLSSWICFNMSVGWLLRYVLTMVVCMCFMFVLICALFMVLGFVLMSVVSFVLLNVVCFLSLSVTCCVAMWCSGCVGCFRRVLVSDVHPVAILSAVFCVISSLLMFVSAASGDDMVKTYSSMCFGMALYVASIVSFCFIMLLMSVLRVYVLFCVLLLLCCIMCLGSRVIPSILWVYSILFWIGSMNSYHSFMLILGKKLSQELMVAKKILRVMYLHRRISH